MATEPTQIPQDLLAAAEQPQALSTEDAASLAALVSGDHRTGKQRKRLRDLTAEKFMIHIDGESEGQYVDVINGTRLGPVPNPDGAYRAQANLLRPITENFVAYHTGIPYSVVAEPKSDRVSRDKAHIDTIWANNLIRTQRVNELVAEALFFAAPYGHCPVHATWRDDLTQDLYDPLWNAGNPGVGGQRPGFIDLWVGDPWATVYDPGASRRSVRWASYDRIFHVEAVRDAFKDVQGIDKLKGRKDLPSSSRFQRTVRSWIPNGGRHGSGAIQNAGGGNDELVAIVCRETAPGILPQFPRGRLTIIALNGVADPQVGAWGEPLLLHDGPLPAGRLSMVRFYALNRFDDVYGKAFVADLDDRQILRNQLESLLVEGSIRAAFPQLSVGPAGGVDDDTAAFVRDGIIESTNPTIRPEYLTYPTQWMTAVEERIDKVEQTMFRIGAWQAASRGEGAATQPAAALVSQAKADDSILGPANRGVRGSLVELLQLCHALTKEHAGPFPIPVEASGRDYGYLSKSYITADEMSDEPPSFTVTSAGGTAEARSQQLLNLVQAKGADGVPLLTTKQLHKQFPDASIWPQATDIEEIRERRVQALNYKIRDAVAEFRGASGFDESQMPDEWRQQAVEQAAQQVFAQFSQQHPLLRTDNPQQHIDGLDELSQDEEEDPVVRRVAALRQDWIFSWLASFQPGIPAGDAAPGQGAGPGAPAYSTDSQFGGSITSDAYSPSHTRSEVQALTREASGA